MGIGIDNQATLRELAKSLPEGFSVCELGDQMIATKPVTKLKRGKSKKMWERGPAEPFYRSIGCGAYTSIDANGKAYILADLNLILPWPLGPFDLVTDFGTAEHVFDQAQVWRTLHALTKPGGHIIFEKPFLGYRDHGFYSMHPTLFKDIARANAYEVVYLREVETTRGTLIRGLFRKTADAPFRNPVQGKYRKALKGKI